MANLETRTAKVNAIISLKDWGNKAITNGLMVDLKTWCENNCDIYAFILHDRDVLDDGEIKTLHIHLVFIYKTNRKRLNTILTDLAQYIGVNTLAISIDKMTDLVGSLHYLIHKHNPDKFQYDINEITTNISSGEMDTYMASDSKSMSIEYLIGVISKYRSKIDIMREIGLTYYHVYRNVINDIYNEIYG